MYAPERMQWMFCHMYEDRMRGQHVCAPREFEVHAFDGGKKLDGAHEVPPNKYYLLIRLVSVLHIICLVSVLHVICLLFVAHVVSLIFILHVVSIVIIITLSIRT